MAEGVHRLNMASIKKYITLWEGEDMQLRSLVTSISIDSPQKPQVALMIGFPWSGQIILQRAIQEKTQTSTATNYGHSIMLDSGLIVQEMIASVPIFEGMEEGPFAFSNTKPFPTSGFILTKTYCGGHCISCSPNEFIQSDEQWFNECLSGVKYSVETERTEAASFDYDLVGKHVHLIRNPITNIAARFEHEFESWGHYNPSMQRKYPLSRKGFKKWCRKFNDNMVSGRGVSRRKSEAEYYLTTRELQDLSWKVPCHTDFYRLVQWHNHVNEIVETLRVKHIPVKVLHFEQILAHQAETVDELIEYLGLEKVKEDFNFTTNGLKYRKDYFSVNEKKHIKSYMKHFSSKGTWRDLYKYFLLDKKH